MENGEPENPITDEFWTFVQRIATVPKSEIAKRPASHAAKKQPKRKATRTKKKKLP